MARVLGKRRRVSGLEPRAPSDLGVAARGASRDQARGGRNRPGRASGP